MPARILGLLFIALLCRAEDLAAVVDRLLSASSEVERERILSEPSADLYRACRDRAKQLFDRNQYEPARNAYVAAQAVARRLRDDAEVARCDHGIGSCYLRMLKPADAVAILEHGLRISEAGDYKAVTMDLLRGLAVAQRALGDYAASIGTGQKSLSLARELHDRQGELTVLNNLGIVYGQTGDMRQAATCLVEALRIAESLDANERLSAILLNLASNHSYQGDLQIALTYLERGLREAHTPRDQGLIFSQLAPVQGSLNKDSEALVSYDRALGLLRQASDRRSEAITLFTRSSFFRERGRSDEALEDVKRGLALLEPISDPMTFCDGLVDRALIEARRGNGMAALATAREAEKMARAQGVPVLMESALEAVGVAASQLGRRDEAKAAFQEGVASLEDWRRKTPADQSQGQQFLEDKIGLYHGLIDILVDQGQFENALRVAEQAKARQLTDILRNGRVEIEGGMTPDEKRTERKLARAVAQWNERLAGQPKPAVEMLAARDQAAGEFSAWEARLYATRPKLRLDRAEFVPLTMAGAAELLPDAQTALIEFVVAQDNLFAFLLTRAVTGKVSLVARKLAGTKDEVTRAAKRFRERLASSDYDYRTESSAFYARLIEPFQAILKNKRLLCIVPDGPLWNVPFAALIQPDGRHLIQDYAIFQAPSLTALREIRRLRMRPKSLRAIFAMGDPKMPAGFEPLPDAEDEVRQLEQIYGKTASAIYTGAAATEEQWKAAAPAYSILHLATHGVLNDVNPLYSYLVLSPGAGKEDGMLEAREILGQTLGAQLAILSACETGRGQIRYGEGVMGMSWAFLAAGTPATLVSQWRVESGSTSHLMVAFHRHFAGAGTTNWNGKAQALQRAMLELLPLPKYQHPFYWAGFTLIGDGY